MLLLSVDMQEEQQQLNPISPADTALVLWCPKPDRTHQPPQRLTVTRGHSAPLHQRILTRLLSGFRLKTRCD